MFRISSAAALCLTVCVVGLTLLGIAPGRCGAEETKVDVEAIKKATRDALSKEDGAKLDLGYITEEFVRKAMKEAKRGDDGILDETGKVRNKTKGRGGRDYGNHYFVVGNRVYWDQGNPGTVESYSCGRLYRRYADNFSVVFYGNCQGGYPYYEINWIGITKKE
jgi:hypothetical protein